MSSQIEHTDVGAYALGLLEEDDRRAFEAHLRECGSCAAELGEMAGMAQALSGLGPFADAIDDPGPAGSSGATGDFGAPGDPGTAGRPVSSLTPGAPGAEDPSAPPAPVIDLLRRRQRAERRRRRGTAIIGAAAAAALLATGVTVGSSLGGDGSGGDQHSAHGPAQALVIWGERHSASNPATGASGVVGLENKGWGTHVGLELRGIKGPLKCHLEAVSRTGERTVVTGWQVPPKGYGVPGSQAPLITHGGTALTRNEIARFDVVIDGGSGGTLLSIPL